MNATDKIEGGAWQLHSNEDQYPILKNEKRNHWSKYKKNIKHDALEGRKLMNLKNIWNAIDTAFTSTLNGNQGLRKYDILPETIFGNGNSCSSVGTYTDKSRYQSMQ